MVAIQTSPAAYRTQMEQRSTGCDGSQYKGRKTVKIMATGNAYQSPKRCQSHNENPAPTPETRSSEAWSEWPLRPEKIEARPRQTRTTEQMASASSIP